MKGDFEQEPRQEYRVQQRLGQMRRLEQVRGLPVLEPTGVRPAIPSASRPVRRAGDVQKETVPMPREAGSWILDVASGPFG